MFFLQDLKQLFDPINPDKEVLSHRELTRSAKLESEFWLLQRLESVMEKANFRELDPDVVKRFLGEHQTPEGVKVMVDVDRYDVLRFWTLGFERPEVIETFWEKLRNKILKRPPRLPAEYYKRVVLAVRLKGSTRLLLKGFKEVPSNKLETLLPDGRVSISPIDKSILATSASIAASATGRICGACPSLKARPVHSSLGIPAVGPAVGAMEGPVRGSPGGYVRDSANDAIPNELLIIQHIAVMPASVHLVRSKSCK